MGPRPSHRPGYTREGLMRPRPSHRPGYTREGLMRPRPSHRLGYTRREGLSHGAQAVPQTRIYTGGTHGAQAVPQVLSISPSPAKLKSSGAV